LVAAVAAVEPITTKVSLVVEVLAVFLLEHLYLQLLLIL
jgi:hypothetical protein